MPIDKIFSCLVYPGKHLETQPSISGAEVPFTEKLFNMFNRHFENAKNECKVEISFNCETDGTKTNNIRTKIIELVEKKSLLQAIDIAQCLQNVTTNKSGLSLLFFVIGTNNNIGRIFISRFPADHGIIAQDHANTLEIEFIEKVFMKNTLAYKAVFYDGLSDTSTVWDGFATDRQINNNESELSNYWIKDFLLSDFKITSAAGTKRLAEALKKVISSNVSSEIKMEIFAAIQLSKNIDNKVLSINSFCENYQLSEETKSALKNALHNQDTLSKRFTFSCSEFFHVIPFKSIELDNGAVLTAPTQDFDTCFTTNQILETPGKYIYQTCGIPIDNKLRKQK